MRIWRLFVQRYSRFITEKVNGELALLKRALTHYYPKANKIFLSYPCRHQNWPNPLVADSPFGKMDLKNRNCHQSLGFDGATNHRENILSIWKPSLFENQFWTKIKDSSVRGSFILEGLIKQYTATSVTSYSYKILIIIFIPFLCFNCRIHFNFEKEKIFFLDLLNDRGYAYSIL